MKSEKVLPSIGQGKIGLELFRYLTNHDRFQHLPGILETPIPKGETYRQELELLRITEKSENIPTSAAQDRSGYG